MNKFLRTATFFVAAYALSAGASAQNVYKCGNTYSQKPCPDGVVVDVQDARTPAQKAEADAKTHREMAQVNAIEKAHEKEEAQARAAQAKRDAAERKKAAAAKPRTTASDPADTTQAVAPKGKGKKARSTKLKKDPGTFVASTPADKTQGAPASGKDKSKGK